ncbi:hypothetical protein EG328_000905 [Venturia inaequalis]|uniref:N-acetylglucosamine-6-phosphate deacetylase n=1 Tax=Venturia inaequalis TaxID=5025 RepID=A0A8H3VGB4_VENIN|nr:hypothetical protein EG328_000905 [Venturia inaequalis]RDI82103.1 hypothetical protein Vi05172_g7939 [Venturia inaequalis]
MPGYFTTFTNCRVCRNGHLINGERFVVSEDTGLILESTGFIGGEIVDLEDAIIAPGFLELHANGVNGFHFTQYEDEEQYRGRLEETARFYVTKGVTSFWATIPTVSSEKYKKILPALTPRAHPSAASLLGCHAEGPYLHPSKHGAHSPELFQEPSTSLTSTYGPHLSNLKLVTVAPELDLASPLIGTLTSQSIRVSLGHSSATFEQGRTALSFGANCLTHAMNCMEPLHQRNPGLVGLITLPEEGEEEGGVPVKPPFFSILADGVHVHPTVATLLYRAAPQRAILISDSIELAGLPDGTYPGNAQIQGNQVKAGAVATMEGTDTLIGAVSTVDNAVKNLIKWSACNVAEAVRCVTENVADMMGVLDRGVLVEGRRGDFVVLDDEGTVLETWVAGKQVWRCEGREAYY